MADRRDGRSCAGVVPPRTRPPSPLVAQRDGQLPGKAPWPDFMQVALSVKQGTVSSVTLLRRLNNRSRKNQIYQAFREVGRAVRAIVLTVTWSLTAAEIISLRYDHGLREQIQRATNKAEVYDGFTKWLHFGNAGWLASRDPELQDKAIKFLDLVAVGVIFSTTIDMTRA
ncbi:Tn3 family transposase [Streptomyces sp. NPDC056304]|uniref:Tn3 family transposase n=1 Tax=Streptomyces sp. NPDC056304 TaxID=3345778 RepID=UPI0035D5EAD8